MAVATPLPIPAPGPLDSAAAFFFAIGGWGTLIGAVFSVVLAIVVARLQAKNDRLEKEAAKTEERRKRDDAAADEARRAAFLRKNTHWQAAVHVIDASLFSRAPKRFRDELVDKIVEALHRTTGLDSGLFRAARLFVEARLLAAARTGSAAIPLEGSTVEETFAELRPTLEETTSRPDGRPETVEFNTCFDLDELAGRDGDAVRYFLALQVVEKAYQTAKIDVKHVDRFLTEISVRDGFIAPMYLVSGILRQFKTDWGQALRRFNDTLGSPNPALLPALVGFEFYCWLLWGPSIPVCDCNRWQGDFRVLQYGYGDEANSFPLILDKRIYDSSWPTIKQRLRAASAANPLPMAIAGAFEGNLVWGPRYVAEQRDVPNIYTVPTNGEAVPVAMTFNRTDRARRPIFDGIVLRATADLAWKQAPSSYYSAYLWVMFEICDSSGKPLYERVENRWRSLFPLFEHSNAAEGQTLGFLKGRLAEKAARTIAKLESDAGGARRFRYLCAADDPGGVENLDGAHRFHFRTEAAEDAALRNDVFKDGRAPKKRELLAIEEQRLRNMLLAALPNDEARTRMFAPHDRPEHVISSCDLPDIVEDFYRDFLKVPLTP